MEEVINFMEEIKQLEYLEKHYKCLYTSTADIYEGAKQLAQKICNGNLSILGEYNAHLNSLLILGVNYRTEKMKEAIRIMYKNSPEI